MLFLQFARIIVLNILSYLRNYWANRPECQRVVPGRLACAYYIVVSSICKNKCFNIVSYPSLFSESIGPIDLSVNALSSAGNAAQTTLLFLQFARISVLNILSYLRNYWANRPECQRVVLSKLGYADYTVVYSICKNKVLNILSYLRNYWADRPECQRVVLSRRGCADCNVVSSICQNKV